MKSKLLPYFAWLILCLLPQGKTVAQQKQVSIEHAAWEAAFVNFRVSDKFSLYTDMHHINGAFTVARLGLTHHLPHHINATAGYSFAWLTVPGTDSEALKRHEHRPWLQVFVPHTVSRNLSLSTRLRYDMRYKQKVEQGRLLSGYEFNHRLRLQETLRLNLSFLKTMEIIPYFILSNEVFLNFGKRIVHNTFDQNRLGLMAGMERGPLRLQTGYMNRFVQSGSVPNRYTNNHNFTLWLFYTLDLRKQEEQKQ
ncbi:DUF2490 domain-containing protein [Pontibacter cellulosilyticus]|uniref:DUF2490 domain-containing protein n=1 Tax=Pontibacter cellulosilyticus TaxID=1720253 RepID=A0A923N1V4_9BACT|nr:DUF2490 domain-containing protein [Pontibacter cellulosilyticus]MBC5991320.1 DUF2490 domain-containing protein [Pontibacter cellulosilyticus]